MRRLTVILNRAVIDHPWMTIVLYSLVTLVLGAQLRHLQLELDVRKMLPANHPDMVYEDWSRDFFDLVPPAVIVITSDHPDGIFTPESLAVIEFISDRIEALPIVDGKDLVSLAAIDNITADDDTLVVEPFYEQAPTTAAGARAVRDAVFANPMVVGNIVSIGGKATLILVEGLPDTDKVELHDALQTIVAEAPITNEKITIAGRAVIEGEMGRVAQDDVTQMFPFVILLIAVLLAIAMRCARGVILPLLVVITSVVWTFGLMAWTGTPVYTISSSMPTLLIAIGVADGIHIIHHFLMYAGEHRDAGARDATLATMNEMFAPVVMTSVTTAAGFFSIAISPLASLRILGTFIAVGVLAAMVFSLTLLPALLCVLPMPRRAAERTVQAYRVGNLPAARLLTMLSHMVIGRPRTVIAVGTVVTLFFVTGIPRVEIEASLLDNFPKGHQVAAADRTIREYFRGSTPIEVVLDAKEIGGWKDPVRLKRLVEMQNALKDFERLGKTRSIADYIRRMNQVMNPDDHDADRIPDDRDLIAQYLLLYSMSGDPGDLDDVVDYDYRYANVRTTVAGDSSQTINETVRFIEDYLLRHIRPHRIDARITGIAQTSQIFVDLIISSQIRSLAMGLLLVAIMAAVFSRSVIAGLYCLIPVAIATVANFALLGWSGVPLGVTTALTSSMGIGIGIDYAIHFVVRYRREVSVNLDPAAAIVQTMNTTGVAIFYNAFVVMSGFLALMSSGFLVNQRLGLMAAVNMAICFTATMTILAAALYYWKPAFTRSA